MQQVLSYKVIGRHLREARQRLSLKQEQVAEMADMSAPLYGKMERGEIRPNVLRLAAVCNVLRIPLSSVFEGATPDGFNLSNIDHSVQQFDQFFHELGMRVSPKTKTVMMAVCASIAEIE